MSKTGKTLFVDFKNKKLTHIEEGEILTEVKNSKNHGPAPTWESAFDQLFSIDAFGEMPPALKVDPANYIENSIQKFERLLDEQGLFDQKKYRDPVVLADALRVYALLQREIPMLKDVLANLGDMIQSQTGHDPAFKVNGQD